MCKLPLKECIKQTRIRFPAANRMFRTIDGDHLSKLLTSPRGSSVSYEMVIDCAKAYFGF